MHTNIGRRRPGSIGRMLCGLLALGCILPDAAAAGDRLTATGGVTELEGAGGGGITPWALIAGLGTDREIGGSVACTDVSPRDFTLRACGANVGFYNRLELSVGEQTLQLGSTAPGREIRLTTLGAKWRLVGDAVIDQDRWWPQVALGVQWKHNRDFDEIPRAIGAQRATGTDVYLAATKIYLDGIAGRSWVVDVTLRETEANQLGLLGFGGDRGTFRLVAEGSVGAFLTDTLLVGAEYRQKPDNLSAFRENAFCDLFMAWFPWKYVSLTVAWAELGRIADKASEQGPYVSLQGTW